MGVLDVCRIAGIQEHHGFLPPFIPQIVEVCTNSRLHRNHHEKVARCHALIFNRCVHILLRTVKELSRLSLAQSELDLRDGTREDVALLHHSFYILSLLLLLLLF